VKYINTTSLRTDVESLKDITVFAPANAAFYAARPKLVGLSHEELSRVLSYHIVKGVNYSYQLMDNQTLPTVQGGTLKVRISTNGTVFVNNARVVKTDFLTKNGVIHIVDSILML
jgi:transforming growth factor-beta-induced protein